MSVRQTAAVWALRLPHNEAWVLMALADHADDDGKRVYPSMGYLAWKTGYGERQVRRIMGRLKERGVIEPVRHRLGGRSPTGHGYATEYWLYLEKADKKSPYRKAASAEDATDQPRGAAKSGLGGPPSPARGAMESGNGATAMSAQPSGTILEPPEQPSDESPGWILILRDIPGWTDKRGTPVREAQLIEWVRQKGYSDDDAEGSAIGLSKMKDVTKRYSDLPRAFQDRLRKGYDRNGDSPTPAAVLADKGAVLRHGPIDRGDGGAWAQVVEIIKEQIPPSAFKTYVAETRGMGFAGRAMIVGVPNEVVASQLDSRYWTMLEQALAGVTGQEGLDLVFEVMT
jgi:hypothetical protein